MDEVLTEDLRRLRQLVDTKASRLAIETLITVYRNIKQHAGNAKYTRIRTGNQAFHSKIWKYRPAVDFMRHSGWEPVSDEWNEIILGEDNFVDMALQILLDHRNVTPSQAEWDEETKLEGKSAEQLRDEELKRRAIEQRDRELAAFFKDKKEREIIAKYVKAEHKADRDRVKYLRMSLPTNDSDEATETHSMPSSGKPGEDAGQVTKTHTLSSPDEPGKAADQVTEAHTMPSSDEPHIDSD